jgi:hypothetical protein
MRQPRFRLRTIMIAIAFLALILTIFMQSVFLRRAAVREQMFRAQVEQERVHAIRGRELAEALRQQAQAAAEKAVAPGP